MLSAQGPAQDPGAIFAHIVVLEIAVIQWWRLILMVIVIAVVVVLGLGAVVLFHDMHLTVR